uniref:Uncharacterized protein n=1 Tax=Arundo donax TaxID=35708 RepID=A0A0A9CX24_ARUDO
MFTQTIFSRRLIKTIIRTIWCGWS